MLSVCIRSQYLSRSHMHRLLGNMGTRPGLWTRMPVALFAIFFFFRKQEEVKGEPERAVVRVICGFGRSQDERMR